MRSLQERVGALRPHPVVSVAQMVGPFMAAVVLAMVIDVAVGPALGATWSKMTLDVGIAIVLAGSLNVVNGYAGQFSIGHAGFMLVGGYAAAWLTFYGSIHFFDTKETVGGFLGQGQQLFLAGCLLGGVIAAGLGVLVGLPTLRLRGDYLAIVTLGFGEIVSKLGEITAPQPKSVKEVGGRSMFELTNNLGGSKGFAQIPGYTRLFFVYLFAFVLLILIYRLKRSSQGRGLLAIRENEIAAEAVGVDTTRAKVVAFVFGAFFAGIGGALYAHQLGTMAPLEINFVKSIDLVVIVVIGGTGSISGVVLASVLLTTLPQILREAADWHIWDKLPVIGDPIQGVLGEFSKYRMIVYALALIVVMLLRPQGIMGIKELWETSWWRRAGAWLAARRRGVTVALAAVAIAAVAGSAATTRWMIVEDEQGNGYGYGLRSTEICDEDGCGFEAYGEAEDEAASSLDGFGLIVAGSHLVLIGAALAVGAMAFRRRRLVPLAIGTIAVAGLVLVLDLAFLDAVSGRFEGASYSTSAYAAILGALAAAGAGVQMLRRPKEPA